MAGRTVHVIVFVALALAGCAAPVANHAIAPAPADASADEGPRNLWLLDAPRPFGTTVSRGAEPLMHVSRDGSTLLIADWTGLYRSTDNGATWSPAPNPFLEAFNILADGWALAEDDAGRLYAADTNGPIVGVASSADYGATWDVQSKVVAVDTIADRPWLAARGDGEVALIVNGDRGEECYRSTDGGMTWLSRSHVNNGRPNAGNVVFDSKGRLWFSNGNDGNTLWRWANPCLNAPLPIQHPAGGPQIFVQVGVDAQDRLYFAQPSEDSTQMLLWGFTPTDGFRSLAVSAPVLQSNTFGAISVHDNGEIAVGWYGSETAGDPSDPAFDGAWNVFVARVSGFWTDAPAIRHDRLTTEANHVGDFCMSGIGCTTGSGDRDLLDYFGVDHAPDGTVHVAYGHDGNGSREEVRYARLPPT